ncbi:hypothetical protein [Tengunoibacter tsumagoiensis]|uniref:Uncharacterized protein n=1 Tax=Tengunoibacter tsumagoiensis TaxID=2014871 RepID=A0A402A414_9CHLR|nr:hypothetical protein [Tengunoibacter tsumagoiensis]GCE13894.1 hypothetical protein KTT_37530 [Tengunoibacter tsumagoiensis]
MISSFLVQLLILGLILLLVAALWSPFEALGWWAGWFGSRPHQLVERPLDDPDKVTMQYVVYLSGIGAIGGDFLEREEQAFLDRLQEQLPQIKVVRDVFPYAMNNNGLTGQRFFTMMWRWIKQLKLQNHAVLTNLINIRNMFQVAVSADRRYGPIYNYGTAGVIVDGLLRSGYRMSSGIPVTLLGFSGGVQVALGSATYLKPLLQAPLSIISFGGVMADDPGLEMIEHLYHFRGSRDPVNRLGAIAYAGRWPLLSYSPWNKARRQGKITEISAGPVTHNDPGGYFLPESEQEPYEETPQGKIFAQVVALLQAVMNEQKAAG